MRASALRRVKTVFASAIVALTLLVFGAAPALASEWSKKRTVISARCRCRSVVNTTWPSFSPRPFSSSSFEILATRASTLRCCCAGSFSCLPV